MISSQTIVSDQGKKVYSKWANAFVCMLCASCQDLPEGYINQLSGSILDAFIAAHELRLHSLPLWRQGFLKDSKFQVLYWRYHCLNAFYHQINALQRYKMRSITQEQACSESKQAADNAC